MPQMQARGYAPSLASGCIAAGSTLGQRVPQSTIVVLHALLVGESIGAFYMAILVPTILTMVLYIVTIAILVRLKPDLAPRPQAFDGGGLAGTLRGGHWS